ncbi:hypothetical protein QFZ76_003294 [Streptomyces sp. V4I2]|nr:hypothetical protein [Streptomyces sp. V4I2]
MSGRSSPAHTRAAVRRQRDETRIHPLPGHREHRQPADEPRPFVCGTSAVTDMPHTNAPNRSSADELRHRRTRDRRRSAQRPGTVGRAAARHRDPARGRLATAAARAHPARHRRRATTRRGPSPARTTRAPRPGQPRRARHWPRHRETGIRPRRHPRRRRPAPPARRPSTVAVPEPRRTDARDAAGSRAHGLHFTCVWVEGRVLDEDTEPEQQLDGTPSAPPFAPLPPHLLHEARRTARIAEGRPLRTLGLHARATPLPNHPCPYCADELILHTVLEEAPTARARGQARPARMEVGRSVGSGCRPRFRGAARNRAARSMTTSAPGMVRGRPDCSSMVRGYARDPSGTGGSRYLHIGHI